MKLTKKLLSTQVNSLRPYKSRSQRPCDFCRRRKTCCIIENSIPCTACIQFNHGNCTFKEGPIKRVNRNSGQKNANRVKKVSYNDPRPSHIKRKTSNMEIQSTSISPIVQNPTPASEVDLLTYNCFPKTAVSEHNAAVQLHPGHDFMNQVPQNLMKHTCEHTAYASSSDGHSSSTEPHFHYHDTVNIESSGADEFDANNLNQYQLASAKVEFDYKSANESNESDSSIFDQSPNYSSPSFQIASNVELKEFKNSLMQQQNQQMLQMLQVQNQQQQQLVMNYQNSSNSLQYQNSQQVNFPNSTQQQFFNQQQMLAYLNLTSTNVDLTNMVDLASFGKANFDQLQAPINTNFFDS